MSTYKGNAPPNFTVGLPQTKQLVPKKHPITNDYTILTKTLGVGVNGKVLECIHKASGDRRALKVHVHTLAVGLSLCSMVIDISKCKRKLHTTCFVPMIAIISIAILQKEGVKQEYLSSDCFQNGQN